MPDSRKNRGPHPKDAALFAAAQLPTLRAAMMEYSWLLTHGYSEDAALKLVGDRHQLTSRQRMALRRVSCSDAARLERQQRERQLGEDSRLWIDGFNLLITIESALSGGIVIVGRDGCLRDLASIHGTYRRVDQTQRAIELAAQHAHHAGVRELHWLLDRPVSNSGKLRALIEEHAPRDDLNVTVELVTNPDRELVEAGATVVSSDSWVVDHASGWVNLARRVIERSVPDAWLVDLR